jgi:hypothetical protein
MCNNVTGCYQPRALFAIAGLFCSVRKVRRVAAVACAQRRLFGQISVDCMLMKKLADCWCFDSLNIKEGRTEGLSLWRM